MPELPEVETMRRGILGAIGGTIVSVSRPKSKYRPLDMSPAWATFRRGISNRVIDNVRRLGKRVLVDLDSGHSIVVQPMMSGLLLVGDPPTKQHVRLMLVIEGSTIGEILYWDARGLLSMHLGSK